MASLADLLVQTPTFFEGAIGSFLMQTSLPPGQPSEWCTIHDPDGVAAVHAAYREAGAVVSCTNTFNGNRLRLRQAGLETHFEPCNREAVRLARQSAGAQGWVAATIGPLGQLLAPSGEVSREAAEACFREQASLLAACGVDLFLVETMFDRAEAEAALAACLAVSDRPVVVTMTFSRTPRGFFTMMGQSPGDVLPALADQGAAAVGANCTLDSHDMVALAGQMRGATSAPLLVQPNAGQPDLRGEVACYPETAETYADNAVKLMQAGVEMIGGCCGTTPAFIRLARVHCLAARDAG